MARAHHTDTDGGEQFHVAAREQHRGRVINAAQRLRVACVTQRDDLRACTFQQLLLRCRVFKTGATGHGTGECAAQACVFQFSWCGIENRTGRLKAFQQNVGAPRSQTGCQAESQPEQFFFRAQ